MTGPIRAGSVVCVVGGNRGLGLELVKALVAWGCEVYATVRGQDAGLLAAAGPAGVIKGKRRMPRPPHVFTEGSSKPMHP
jgi:NAD(P)-dependent dehydrogenase (short-subunit alcohol dehydrogenase family)